MFTVPWKRSPKPSAAGLSVLVVCTGNICRSPMAAHLLQHMLPAGLRERVCVGSAGTYALHGNQAAPPAVQVMAEAGIDISGHRARQITGELIRGSGLIVAMQRIHLDTIKRMQLWSKARARLLGEFGPQPETPEIDDPYGGPIDAYRSCLEIIRPCIMGLIAHLSGELPDLQGSGSIDAP